MTNSSSFTHPSPSPSSIAVIAQASGVANVSAGFASMLALPLISSLDDKSRFELVLEIGKKGLSLVPTDRKHGGGIRVDFVAGPTAYRRLTTGSTRQPLAKAVGLRQGRPSVIDATAGLGRDAFQLACLGCRVRAVERSPILAAMLDDALARASRAVDPKLTEIVKRITVISGDSKTVLSSLAAKDRPEVVYLDPMYTPRASSALAKKEMRILRMLVGGDEDSGELLRIARSTATKRVVVKRHLRAPPLAKDVTMTYPGRTVRYDVYPVLSSGL